MPWGHKCLKKKKKRKEKKGTTTPGETTGNNGASFEGKIKWRHPKYTQ